MRNIIGYIVIGIAGLAVGYGASLMQGGDSAAAEQRIRALDEQWVAAVATKDAAAVAAFYAEDGSLMAPNGPAADGRDAVTAAWGGMLALKNLQLSFAPTTISVAKAGDVAIDIGTYTLAFDSDQGPVKDQGKYVVVWKKVEGDWQVAADIFNSNGTAP